MNKYLIQKKIVTPIEAEDTFEIGGYTIAPYTETYQPNLLITRELEALSYIEAMKTFLIELEPIVNSLTVLSQTMIYPLAMGSMLAYRINDNNDRYFFAQIAASTEIVGMSITEEVIQDAKKMLEGSELVALTYLREAINAFSATQKLSMLISAAEAFAGTAKTQGTCKSCDAPYEYTSTNKDALRKILGVDLYSEIYEKTRIRHKLAHGGDAEIPEAVAIGEKAYTQIVLVFLKEKYGLESLVPISGAPRGFSFEYSRCGCRMISEGTLSLRSVELEWEAHEHKLFYFDELPINY